MAVWTLLREPDGQMNVLYKDKDIYKSAGRCTAATPVGMIMQWLVNVAEAGDLIVTDEGKFALPFRTPRQSEVAC